jgi:quinol monooxygenase YgiN
MENTVIHVVARTVCRAEKTAELIGILQNVAEQSRREPGCLSYAVLRSTEDPNEIGTVELWRDKAAIDAHFRMPYVQDLFARVPGLVAQAPEVKTYIQA